MVTTISWLLSVIGALGAYYAGKTRWGWFISLLYQVLWIPYALITEQYGFVWICVIFAVIYAKNFYEGGKNAVRISNDREEE